MSIFGLVHGGGLGTWCWELLLSELKERGHHAVTMDLPLEDQSAGATHFAEAVLEAFDGLDDLILVGHSLAGLIIPLVAAQRPVKRLIFIHALLPRPGQSAADQFRAEPDMFNPEMFTAKAPFWEDEVVAKRFLFHDCPPEVARDARGALAPHRL